jgi:tetratricopeptide (TPR) repeat protein
LLQPNDLVVTSQAASPSSNSHRDELHRVAADLRKQGRVAEALAALDQLERLFPGFSALYEERGHCLFMLGDAGGALEAFSRAVAINPALASSWNSLERLHRVAGRDGPALNAALQSARLAEMPSPIVLAGSLFSDGDFAAAEQTLRESLAVEPRWQSAHRSEAVRLLGRIAQRKGVLDEAEELLAAAVDGAPSYLAARLDLIRVMIERQRYAAALGQSDALLAMRPEHDEGRSLRATVHAGLGRHQEAIDEYRQLLSDFPERPHLHILLGHSLRAIGDQDGAIAAYRAALAARAEFGDAYWSLANLKTYRFLDDEVEAMRAAEVSPRATWSDRAPLCFALGKAHEDRGESSAALAYYERGNAIKRAESRYRPELTEINARLQVRICNAQFFAQREGWGVDDRDPIFIVGLPRSGSTLLEQILASHTLVEGTHELFDITRIVLELQGRNPDPLHPRYPDVLAHLDRDAFERLGRRYLDETRVYRTGRPYFIDKMPNNFRHVALIHLMLPNARIIDVRREPMACCVSNLRQLYARGQDFSYSLEDIARYYRTYIDLMRHWDVVLRGRVLRVFYEDLIDDLEGGVRAALRYCGLEFEPACVDFHRSGRAVTTASSEQVRQPVFREGLSQWRNFERWLAPLKEALGDALVRYREEVARGVEAD